MLRPEWLSWSGTTLQIVLVDVLLSADNAVIIALACRSLRPEERRQAYVAGTIGAVAMRLLFASGIVSILQIPFLKVAGGAILLVIAIRLVAEELPPQPQWTAEPLPEPAGSSGLWRAVAAILIGDITMSLDNVVAVAALASGSLLLLVIGLAISIPLLVFGSTQLHRLIDGSPVLVLLAGMLLGWVAGSIAVSDPALSEFLAHQAPALAISLPAGAAVLVLWQALILRRRIPALLPKL